MGNKQSLKDELSKLMRQLRRTATGPVWLPWNLKKLAEGGRIPDELLARLPSEESVSPPRSRAEMKAFNLAIAAFAEELKAELSDKGSEIYAARHGMKIRPPGKKKCAEVEAFCRKLTADALWLSPDRIFRTIGDAEEPTEFDIDGRPCLIRRAVRGEKQVLAWSTHGRHGYLTLSTFGDYIYAERLRRNPPIK